MKHDEMGLPLTSISWKIKSSSILVGSTLTVLRRAEISVRDNRPSLSTSRRSKVSESSKIRYSFFE